MSRTYIRVALRQQVIDRAKNCCEYCRISQNDIFFSFEVDHIIAEKHGGSTTASNLCLSCPDCNAFKGSDIASVDWSKDESIVPLFHPRRDTWDEHFRLDTLTGKLLPLTAAGRVTAHLLQLNQSERIVDRKLLIEANRYPCK